MTAKIRIILIEVVITAILTVVAFFVWQEFNSTAVESAEQTRTNEVFTAGVSDEATTYSNYKLQMPSEAGSNCKLESREWEKLQAIALGDFKTRTAAEDALRNAVAFLRESNDPEHKLAAGLLVVGDDITGRFPLFKTAFESRPFDPLTTNMYFRSCLRDGISTRCDIDRLEQRLIEVDGSNTEAWSLIVSKRWQSGDESAALDAMRHAVTAPETNDYYTERVGVIQRGLAASGFGSQAQQITTALGYANTVRISLGGPIEACTAASRSNPQWRSLCLELGKKVEQESRMPDYYQMGLGLQRLMLRETGDSLALAEVERKIDKLREWGRSNFDRDFDAEFYSDVTMLNDYLNALETHGQFAAFERYFAFRELWRAQRCEAAEIGTER